MFSAVVRRREREKVETTRCLRHRFRRDINRPTPAPTVYSQRESDSDSVIWVPFRLGEKPTALLKTRPKSALPMLIAISRSTFLLSLSLSLIYTQTYVYIIEISYRICGFDFFFVCVFLILYIGCGCCDR